MLWRIFPKLKYVNCGGTVRIQALLAGDAIRLYETGRCGFRSSTAALVLKGPSTTSFVTTLVFTRLSDVS